MVCRGSCGGRVRGDAVPAVGRLRDARIGVLRASAYAPSKASPASPGDGPRRRAAPRRARAAGTLLKSLGDDHGARSPRAAAGGGGPRRSRRFRRNASRRWKRETRERDPRAPRAGARCRSFTSGEVGVPEQVLAPATRKVPRFSVVFGGRDSSSLSPAVLARVSRRSMARMPTPSAHVRLARFGQLESLSRLFSRGTCAKTRAGLFAARGRRPPLSSRRLLRSFPHRRFHTSGSPANASSLYSSPRRASSSSLPVLKNRPHPSFFAAVACVRRLYTPPPAPLEPRLPELLELVHLLHREDVRVQALELGQQRLAAILPPDERRGSGQKRGETRGKDGQWIRRRWSRRSPDPARGSAPAIGNTRRSNDVLQRGSGLCVKMALRT